MNKIKVHPKQLAEIKASPKGKLPAGLAAYLASKKSSTPVKKSEPSKPSTMGTPITRKMIFGK